MKKKFTITDRKIFTITDRKIFTITYRKIFIITDINSPPVQPVKTRFTITDCDPPVQVKTRRIRYPRIQILPRISE